MGDFASRLRVAITNYAAGAINYKSFAALVDLPYRTLQNYINGERSPNIEALGKLSDNGLNIDWLISGRGVPYNNQVPPKDIIDLVFVLYMKDIFKTILSEKSLLSEHEKIILLSYCMANNYLGVGDVIHGLIESGLGEPKAIFSEISNGDIDYMLDNVPRNKKELQNALRKVKEAVRRSLEIAPTPGDGEVGE